MLLQDIRNFESLQSCLKTNGGPGCGGGVGDIPLGKILPNGQEDCSWMRSDPVMDEPWFKCKNSNFEIVLEV